jgi:hypothetical protein
MNNTWMQETLEILNEWEREHAILDDRISELENERAEIEDKIISAHALIQAYKQKHNIQGVPSLFVGKSLLNKSYPQILIDLAKEKGGYLSVMDAVDYLVHSNFGDKRNIQANIYSALRRMVNNKQFKRMKPGEYRYLNSIVKDDKPSGLRQIVKDLKDKHPQMTKKEVYKYLIDNKFDFKGKRPMSALNITWAYLGYSKEGKQQSLLGVD